MTEQKQARLGVGAVVIHQGQVLLVKRKTPPYAGQWAIPGGKVHYGESLKAAAEREVLEETGITIQAGEPIYSFEIIQRDSEGPHLHYVVIDLEASYLGGKPIARDDAAEAAWFDEAGLQKVDLNQITRELLVTKYQFSI
jgi:ADP-ribose pyrophosphatase